MTDQSQYEAVCSLLYEYDRIAPTQYADAVIANPFQLGPEAKGIPFYWTAAKLLASSLESMSAKRTGKKPSISAIKRVIKGANQTGHPDFACIYPEAHGNATRYCICDGCRAIALYEDIPSLPHPDPTDKGERIINTLSLIEKAVEARGVEIPLPTVAEVKAHIAQKRAQTKEVVVPMRIDQAAQGGQSMYVDARYLLDMLQILPGCRAYQATSRLSPIPFEAETGIGLLMPLRPNEYDEEEAESEVKKEERRLEEERRQREEEDREKARQREEEEKRLEEEKNQSILRGFGSDLTPAQIGRARNILAKEVYCRELNKTAPMADQIVSLIQEHEYRPDYIADYTRGGRYRHRMVIRSPEADGAFMAITLNKTEYRFATYIYKQYLGEVDTLPFV